MLTNKVKFNPIDQYKMFKNIIKSSIRHLLKRKWYSIINLFSLTIGFAVFIIITIFVRHEASYDRFHKDSSKIYRLEEKLTNNGIEEHWAATNGYLVNEIVNEFPEVTDGIRMMKSIWSVINHTKYGKFPEKKFAFVDSTFFDFFDFKLISGDPKTVLSGISSVVLTESTAKKYFGDRNPIGKVILYDGGYPFEVTGIIEDIPENSHFHFDLFFPIDCMLRYFDETDYGDNVFYSYIKIQNKDNTNQFVSKLNRKTLEFKGYQKYASNPNFSVEVIVRSLLDIHLKGNKKREIEKNGNNQLVNILILISILILGLSCINFANLSIVSSMTRGKEIGIRKVVGSDKKLIFYQYLGEAYILGLLAMLAALILVFFILPFFNVLFGIELILNVFNDPVLLALILSTILLVGFLSGAYPAIFLSKVNILSALKLSTNINLKGKKKLSITTFFVVLQFSIAIIFIITSITIWRQLNHIQNKEIGFNKENVLVIPLKGRDVKRSSDIEVLKEKLMSISEISVASVSYDVPGIRYPYHTVRFPSLVKHNSIQPTQKDSSIFMRVMLGDIDMIETFEFEVAEGRGFDPGNISDYEGGFMLNEAAVKFLNLKNPIGEEIEYTFNVEEPRKGKVIGVIRDFHYASIYNEVEPVVIHVINRWRSYLSLRLNSKANNTRLLKKIEKQWAEVFPDIPFDFFFLDENYDRMYSTEQNMKTLVSIFTIMTLIISCLGLLSMSFYIMEKRKREIAIRKVMGASIKSIVSVMSKEFIVLVIIANVIAWIPITYALNEWLNNFTDRISIGFFVFAGTIVFTLSISFLTILYNIIRTARVNPALVLKDE